MSLTAFQRFRRLQQVEDMKPENIQKQHKEIEQPVTEENEEVVEQPVTRRRNRN